MARHPVLIEAHDHYDGAGKRAVTRELVVARQLVTLCNGSVEKARELITEAAKKWPKRPRRKEHYDDTMLLIMAAAIKKSGRRCSTRAALLRAVKLALGDDENALRRLQYRLKGTTLEKVARRAPYRLVYTVIWNDEFKRNDARFEYAVREKR